jgi:hypothetical protein
MVHTVLTTSGLTINIKEMLETGTTVDQVNKQLRGSRGACLHCLQAREQITQAQAKGLDRARIEAFVDSRFRRGHHRKKWDPLSGGYSPEQVMVEPHFVHAEPLLSEVGEPIPRPCESRSREHIAFLDWLMGSARDWCLDGTPVGERTLLLREPRYQTDPPNWRSPDLAIVRCNGAESEQVMQVIGKTGHIPVHTVQMISAIELQLSRISVEEIRQRTFDHGKHFADVRWVFVERHLTGTGEARKWLAENGHDAFVIRQEADKSRVIGIELLPPPGQIGSISPPSPPLPCLRSLYCVWLRKGFHPTEAMARAKGERDELRRLAGESVRLNAELREIYGVELPWQTQFKEVEAAHVRAVELRIEEQRVELERQLHAREEADRLARDQSAAELLRRNLIQVQESVLRTADSCKSLDQPVVNRFDNQSRLAQPDLQELVLQLRDEFPDSHPNYLACMLKARHNIDTDGATVKRHLERIART